MSFYRWCMRFGAVILFAIALVQLVLGLIGIFQLAGYSQSSPNPVMPGYESPSNILVLLQALLAVFSSAALPFLGALLIDRLDRWLAGREAAE